MSAGRLARNSSGDVLTVGMAVERIDNYKRGGKIMAVNFNRGGNQPVLVRWPGLDDEWMHPGILYERKADA